MMEFIVLDNQSFSVEGDVGFRQLVEHRYTLTSVLFLDVALPELHSNSVTAISFTTYYGTPFGFCVSKKIKVK
jgi:hypothetical protein